MFKMFKMMPEHAGESKLLAVRGRAQEMTFYSPLVTVVQVSIQVLLDDLILNQAGCLRQLFAGEQLLLDRIQLGLAERAQQVSSDDVFLR